MKFIFNLDSNTTLFSGMVIAKLVTPNSSVFVIDLFSLCTRISASMILPEFHSIQFKIETYNNKGIIPGLDLGLKSQEVLKTFRSAPGLGSTFFEAIE